MTIRLETERLILRPLAPADADAHMAMMAEPQVAAFLTFDGKPQSRQEAWRQYASYLGHWSIRGFGFFSVFEKAGGAWVGRVGPWAPEGWPGIETGWAVAPAYQCRGYASEAARATIRWTFEQRPDLARMISLIDPKNVASQATARKLGERKTDETFRLHPLTLDVWAADRAEWIARFG